MCIKHERGDMFYAHFLNSIIICYPQIKCFEMRVGLKGKVFFKLAAWLPAIIMAVIISSFSGQESDQSQGLSDRVAGYIIDAADAAGIIDAGGENRTAYVEKLQFPIRKGAHMTEYALFTCTVLFGFYVNGLRSARLYLMAILVTFIYALSDEIHQLFVPGRSGQFADVLIDTSGGLIAILLLMKWRSNEGKNTKKDV